ncbi:MAG: hypothetical protein DHS20C01_14980 [marine bacterium B5-7]|nr:MAG: hypothetical protein DHS20C01_14980 [marine bacterium B5-7]
MTKLFTQTPPGVSERNEIAIHANPCIHDDPRDTLSHVRSGLKFLGAIAVTTDLAEFAADNEPIGVALFDYVTMLDVALEHIEKGAEKGGVQ